MIKHRGVVPARGGAAPGESDEEDDLVADAVVDVGEGEGLPEEEDAPWRSSDNDEKEEEEPAEDAEQARQGAAALAGLEAGAPGYATRAGAVPTGSALSDVIDVSSVTFLRLRRKWNAPFWKRRRPIFDSALAPAAARTSIGARSLGSPPLHTSSSTGGGGGGGGHDVAAAKRSSTAGGNCDDADRDFDQ